MKVRLEGERQILEGESQVRARETDSGRGRSGKRLRDRFWKGNAR